MRPLAAFAAGAAAALFLEKAAYRLRLRCTLRGRHNPFRLRLGAMGFGVSAFGCLDCPKKGATYSDMGFDEDGDQVSRDARARQAGVRW